MRGDDDAFAFALILSGPVDTLREALRSRRVDPNHAIVIAGLRTFVSSRPLYLAFDSTIPHRYDRVRLLLAAGATVEPASTIASYLQRAFDMDMGIVVLLMRYGCHWVQPSLNKHRTQWYMSIPQRLHQWRHRCATLMAIGKRRPALRDVLCDVARLVWRMRWDALSKKIAQC